MFPNRRLPHPVHFEQPFPLAAPQESFGTGPVVGAIVTGPLGALIERTFNAAFAAVARASAAQKLAAMAKAGTPGKRSAAGAKRPRRTRQRRSDSDPS